jgi:hypothetical protein
MAYSKVRWISMPAFLACVGGTHGREEGANVHEGTRTAEVGARTVEGAPQPAVCAPRTSICAPYTSVCAPQPTVCALPTGVCTLPTGICAPQLAVCAPSNPDHPTWQRCGSHCGKSKSRFTLSKVNKMLTLIGRTQTLSDMMDKRTHRQP